MKRISVIILLLISLLLYSCATYKALSTDEAIVLASNPTKSISFLINENGYSVSTKFIVQTQSGDKYYLKEGIKYKEDYSYYTITECDNINLVSDLNNCIYYTNNSGLQGITYQDGNISDISYNYKLDGFGDLMLYYGTNNIISLFNNDIDYIYGIHNQDIVYIANLTEKNKNTLEDYTDILKKTICLYQNGNTLSFKKETHTTRTYKKTGEVEEYSDEVSCDLIMGVSIKKAFVIDYETVSKSVILSTDNIIYMIDNNTLEITVNEQFNNILTFNKADRYYYLIDHNTVYVYDSSNQLYQMIEYAQPIIGSSWFNASNLQSIRVVTLTSATTIKINEISLPVVHGPEILI